MVRKFRLYCTHISWNCLLNLLSSVRNSYLCRYYLSLYPGNKKYSQCAPPILRKTVTSQRLVCLKNARREDVGRILLLVVACFINSPTIANAFTLFCPYILSISIPSFFCSALKPCIDLLEYDPSQRESWTSTRQICYGIEKLWIFPLN